MEDISIITCVLLGFLVLATVPAVIILATGNVRRVFVSHRTTSVHYSFLYDALAPALEPYGIFLDRSKKIPRWYFFGKKRTHHIHGEIDQAIEGYLEAMKWHSWTEEQANLIAQLIGGLVKTCVAAAEEKIHSGAEMDIVFDDEGGIKVVPKT